MSQQLTGAQLRHLKSKAQTMKPDLKMGKNGLSELFLNMVQKELDRKELVKIKFEEMKEQKRELAATLVEQTGAALVMKVGHVVVLFRQNPDPEKQVVKF